MKINRENFKYILKENKLNISTFSKEIGISRDTLNNWLYRQINIPKWKAEIIAEYFIEKTGKYPDELFIDE